MLAKIKKYSENNPDKIIIATGDTCQLETIDLISSEIDYDEYMNHCINIIFPNNICLKENKRLKTEEDKTKLKQFKMDIFSEAIPIQITLIKYFKFTNDIKATNNIAFKNETCCSVSHTIRKLLDKRAEYEIDETLICRKYYKTKAIKFSVNLEYKIVGVGPKYLMIKDIGNDTIYPVSIAKTFYTWLW